MIKNRDLIMQFRLMGKRIQCIRTHYNPTTKKTEAIMVCSIPSSTVTLPDPLGDLEKLTEQELLELKGFLNYHGRNLEYQKLATAFYSAPEILQDTCSYIGFSSSEITQEWADMIWNATDKIRKELKAYGFQKPKANKEEMPEKMIVHSTEKKQVDEPVTNKKKSSKQTKSIFTDFHSEIVSLLESGKTVLQIFEELKTAHKQEAEQMTYNGLRSYIRRNIRK